MKKNYMAAIKVSDIKRRALQMGLLLVVNYAAVACAAFAFGTVVFTNNYIAAFPPAVLAFLLGIWQPWLFLLCLIPYGPVLAPLISVPMTLLIYRTLFQQNKLAWMRYALHRFSPRTLTSCFAGFLVVGALVSYAGYKDIPVQHHGVPNFAGNRWLDEGAVTGYSFSNSRYYTLYSFLDTHFLWRVQVPRSQMSKLVKALAMTPVKNATLPDARFWKQPPFWWQRPQGDVEEYSTDNFPADSRGSDGWHAAAVYHPQTEMLYLWAKDNWD